MANYAFKYIPSQTTVKKNCSSWILLHKGIGTEFLWQPAHQETFDRLKSAITFNYLHLQRSMDLSSRWKAHRICIKKPDRHQAKIVLRSNWERTLEHYTCSICYIQLYQYDFDLFNKEGAKLYNRGILFRASSRDTSNGRTTNDFEVMEVSQISDKKARGTSHSNNRGSSHAELDGHDSSCMAQVWMSLCTWDTKFLPLQKWTDVDNGLIKKWH